MNSYLPPRNHIVISEGVFFMPDIKQQRTIIMDFVKILFLMYFVTLILLLLLAFVLFKMETS